MITKSKFSVRVNESNPVHHIWNNNGSWWFRAVYCPTPIISERVAFSLFTREREEAIHRRDCILGASEAPQWLVDGRKPSGDELVEFVYPALKQNLSFRKAA